MAWQWIFLAVCGVSAGVMISAGVFTVLLAVGLVPRFAGKTHTASKIFLYEEMVVAGTLAGNVCSVFNRFFQHSYQWLGKVGGQILLAVYGVFAGIFVGCLALAIAEMLDSIPIFTRRIGFRHGLGWMILAVAAGKLIGSLLYFGKGLYGIGM